MAGVYGYPRGAPCSADSCKRGPPGVSDDVALAHGRPGGRVVSMAARSVATWRSRSTGSYNARLHASVRAGQRIPHPAVGARSHSAEWPDDRRRRDSKRPCAQAYPSGKYRARSWGASGRP